MRYLIIILIFLLSGERVQSQDTLKTDCNLYHKGRFTYTDSSTGFPIRIVRRTHYQHEYDDIKQIWIDFRITWISGCEYELYQIATNSKSQRKNNHTTRRITITKPLGHDGYEYACSCKDNSGKEVKGKVSMSAN